MSKPTAAVPGVEVALWSNGGPPRSELSGQGGVLRHVNVKAGHVTPRHEHEFEQFLYVVSGHGRLTHRDGVVTLEPGRALRLDAGAWHSAEFTADTVIVEFNVRMTR